MEVVLRHWWLKLRIWRAAWGMRESIKVQRLWLCGEAWVWLPRARPWRKAGVCQAQRRDLVHAKAQGQESPLWEGDGDKPAWHRVSQWGTIRISVEQRLVVWPIHSGYLAPWSLDPKCQSYPPVTVTTPKNAPYICKGPQRCTAMSFEKHGSKSSSTLWEGAAAKRWGRWGGLKPHCERPWKQRKSRSCVLEETCWQSVETGERRYVEKHVLWTRNWRGFVHQTCTHI